MDKRTEKIIISFFVNLILVIVGFFSAIYLGVFLNSKRSIDIELENRGRSIVNSIILARNWNAGYGGVYVEKVPGMSSNPFLKKPDIETIDGKVFTKKNPALMVREISEMVETGGAFEFHITSLQPLNPDNGPDAFEREALVRFETGAKEVFTKERLNESVFFRYMAPLPVEKSCLTCHDRGYQVGDIRGGISVRFNIDAVEEALTRNMYAILALALITFISLAAIIYRLVSQLSRRLREAEARLREMAVTDELTGLKNRRYLVERLRAELKKARRDPKPMACILFDLDHFKRINDTFGHDIGDKVLKEVAHTAREQCRESDILSRFGGEEFVAILPDTDLAGGVSVAERLRQAIMSRHLHLSDGRELSVTASFGLALARPSGSDHDEDEFSLLKRADDALYRAKENGRNRVEKIEE